MEIGNLRHLLSTAENGASNATQRNLRQTTLRHKGKSPLLIYYFCDE
jgi:hypothetical protein